MFARSDFNQVVSRSVKVNSKLVRKAHPIAPLDLNAVTN